MKQEISPYTNSYALDSDDGDITVERRPFRRIPSNNVITHTVMDGETIQNIAFQYYGNSGYWGIIADTNNIYNPFDDLQPGIELIIPTNGGN